MYEFTGYTSPSGEKLNAVIAVVIFVSDDPSKLGRPRGPLASKTFICETLQ